MVVSLVFLCMAPYNEHKSVGFKYKHEKHKSTWKKYQEIRNHIFIVILYRTDTIILSSMMNLTQNERETIIHMSLICWYEFHFNIQKGKYNIN